MPDGGKIVRDLFRLHDQEGLVLADSLSLCDRFEVIPSLSHFCADAVHAGWKRDSILQAVKAGLVDSAICNAVERDIIMADVDRFTWNYCWSLILAARAKAATQPAEAE